MVGHNMNGPTRDQVLKFMEEKERIEREIEELNLVLENNHVGMTDPLLDPEGYPRNDIDVYQIRHARHRIICLQNDHKEMMKQIERGLHALHADFVGPQGEGTSQNRTSVQPMEISAAPTTDNGHSQPNGHPLPNGYSLPNGFSRPNGHSLPNGHTLTNGHDVDLVVERTRDLGMADRAFLKVNLVSPGSPADAAGIRVDDEIIQFGSIDARNYTSLSQIAELVQHSVGARLDVRLSRDSTPMQVTLMPGPWAGRGLLGCNIIPL